MAGAFEVACGARGDTEPGGGPGGDPWAVSPAVSTHAQDPAIPLLSVSPRQTHRRG